MQRALRLAVDPADPSRHLDLISTIWLPIASLYTFRQASGFAKVVRRPVNRRGQLSEYPGLHSIETQSGIVSVTAFFRQLRKIAHPVRCGPICSVHLHRVRYQLPHPAYFMRSGITGPIFWTLASKMTRHQVAGL
jgi:hypothetical protein